MLYVKFYFYFYNKNFTIFKIKLDFIIEEWWEFEFGVIYRIFEEVFINNCVFLESGVCIFFLLYIFLYFLLFYWLSFGFYVLREIF